MFYLFENISKLIYITRLLFALAKKVTVVMLNKSLVMSRPSHSGLFKLIYNVTNKDESLIVQKNNSLASNSVQVSMIFVTSLTSNNSGCTSSIFNQLRGPVCSRCRRSPLQLRHWCPGQCGPRCHPRGTCDGMHQPLHQPLSVEAAWCWLCNRRRSTSLQLLH